MNTQISIIIPVYNETASINQTLGHLVTSIPGIILEVIVVDGHPLGNTIASINPPFHSEKIQLKTIIFQKSGRAVQMNTGAGLVKGKFLLFLHADTILSKQAVGRILRLLDGPICCVWSVQPGHLAPQ